MGRYNRPQAGIRSDVIDPYLNFYLRNARIEAGFTMRQLASAVGVSIPLINSYEHMKTLPDPFVARRLACVLRKKIHEIFPRKIRPLYSEIEAERKRSPAEIAVGELESKTELSESEQRRLRRLRLFVHPKSIYDVSLNGLVEDEDPSEPMMRSEISEKVIHALDDLPFRDREILILRYGLSQATEGYCTLEEVGRIFKVTRDRIRQIEAIALNKLSRTTDFQTLDQGMQRTYRVSLIPIGGRA